MSGADAPPHFFKRVSLLSLLSEYRMPLRAEARMSEAVVS